MKRIAAVLLLSLSALLTPLSGYSSGWVKVGVRGGVRTAVNTGTDVSVSNAAGGLAVNIKLPVQGMSLQPELDMLYKFDRMVAHVPVNIQAGLDLVLVRPFISLTPYVDIPFSHAGEVNRFQTGFAAGGGVDIWRFQVQYKYCWDITDFYGDKSGKMRGSELSLIYFF